MGSLTFKRTIRIGIVKINIIQKLNAYYFKIMLSEMYIFRFLVLNAVTLYAYFTNFQQIDEEEFGGAWELTKEGFVTSLAGFLVINIYLSENNKLFFHLRKNVER